MTGKNSTLTIGDRKIMLANLFTVIDEKVEKEDILDPRHFWIDWSQLLTQLEENMNFSEAIKIINQNSIQIQAHDTDPIGEWENLIGLFRDYEKLIKIEKNLEKVKTVFQKYQKLKRRLASYPKYENYLKKASKNSLYESKQRLLKNLIIQSSELSSKIEIFTDEAQIFASKVHSLRNQKNNVEDSISTLKEQQNILFRETNEITAHLDEKSEARQKYVDKLEVMVKEKNPARYLSLQSKIEATSKDYELYKSQRNEKILQSKNLNKALRELKTQLRQIKKQLNPILPNHNEQEEKISNLQAQMEVLNDKITTTKTELSSLFSKKSMKNNSVQEEETHFHEIKYSSLDQLYEEKQNDEQQEGLIRSQLEKLFKTADLDSIQKDIELRLQKITTKIENLLSKTQTQQKFSKISSSLSNLFTKLKTFTDWINQLLSPIFIEIHPKIQMKSAESKQLEVNLIVYLHGKEISGLSELKRSEKALIDLCLIVSIYLITGSEVVPINIDFLPPHIITQKTFIKAIIELHDSYSRLKLKFKPKIILFVRETTIATQLKRILQLDEIIPVESHSEINKIKSIFQVKPVISSKAKVLDEFRKARIENPEEMFKQLKISQSLVYSPKSPRGYHYQEPHQEKLRTQSTNGRSMGSKIEESDILNEEIQLDIMKVFRDMPVVPSKKELLEQLKVKINFPEGLDEGKLLEICKKKKIISYSRSKPRGYTFISDHNHS